MEVRDSDEKLKKLLESLRIDVEGGQGQNKDPNAPPALPLIDQLRLLSAHIDSYRKTIAETVTKAESIIQIKKHDRSGSQIQGRLKDIESKIKRLSDDKRSTTDGTEVDILQLNVSRSVAEYVKSKQEYENRRHTTILATALREAVIAVEQLETRIIAKGFDQKGIRDSISLAKKQCARLGIRFEKESVGSDVEFDWLGTGPSAPPAIQQLGQRVNLLIKQVDQIIHESWLDCLRIGYSENEGQASVTVMSQSNVEVGGRQSQLSLTNLLALLQDRAELIPLFKSFSNDLLRNIITPILTIHQAEMKSSWQEVKKSSGSWQASFNSAEGKPEAALQAMNALLVYLKEHFFKMAEEIESLRKLQFEFSRIVIPAIVPLVIKYLKSLLPKSLKKPIRQETLGSLSAVSRIAVNVHESLKNNGYLIGGLEEEGEELIDFAQNTGRYFLRHLATNSRSQARDMLLKEMNGGWEGVKVEMEVKVIEPPPSIAQIKSEKSKFSNEEAEDEDWSAWDDAGAQGESNLSVANVKKAAGLDVKQNRVASALSQRSASPASISSNRAKQKKSALGGIRVVKPQDQFGSGPFPDDNLDESSWGFDEGEQSQTTQSTLSKIPNSAHTSMPIVDDEEDAWFQEEPAEQSNVSAAHTSISASNSILSAPPPIDDEDDGDAWFQDEPAERGDISVAHSSISANQSGLPAPPPPQEDEDDAWFEGQSSRQTDVSAASIPSNHSIVAIPPPAPEEDEEGDAWFQGSPAKPLVARETEEDMQDVHQDLSPIPPSLQNVAHVQPSEDNQIPSHIATNSVEEGFIQAQTPADQAKIAPQIALAGDKAWFEEEHIDQKGDAESWRQSHMNDVHPEVVHHSNSDIVPTFDKEEDKLEFNEEPQASEPYNLPVAASQTASQSIGKAALEDSQVDPLVQTTGTAPSHSSSNSDDAWFNDVSVPMTEQKSVSDQIAPTLKENAAEAKQATHPSGSNNSQTSSNSDEAWFKDDMPAAENQPQSKGKESPIRRAHPIETISQSSTLSSPAIIDHHDLDDEDIDEDAWGLTEEEKAKRASIRASRGGADLANAFKAFAEKEKAAASGERSAHLIDLTEEDETDNSIKIKENTQQTLNESTVDASSTPLSHNPESSVQKETCIISQRSITFISLASSLLDDIIAIEEENDGNALGLETKYLADALNDILDLHRALMPVGHAETLNNVPTLAAQFVNDCTYIAKELIKLDERWQGIKKSNNDGALPLAKHAELTALLGQRSFDAQILVQQRILAECLADAHGFEATYDEQRFQACMRSIRQVIVVLQQLHSAWKPVLTTSSHQAAMGRLIDSVLQRVLRDIIALEDISEVEGEKLSTLVKTLADLEEIFRTEKHKQTEEPSSDVAIHVPSWFKASYLSDILTGSLVDIEFLYFEASALVDYTREELVSLIRALFSDTSKRSRLIERIQSAA